MSQSYIAVIDIGKTNKKVLVFDEELTLIDSAYRTFDEYIEDNIHYENLEQAAQWIFEQLGEFARSYTILSIGITAHGASMVGVDEKGELAVPPVAYTTDAGEEFREEFYHRFGSPVDLQKETKTAEIGSLINIAKLLYFHKKKWPEQYERINKILYFPQYFGYLLTGNTGADPTYTGCHTYLFNPEERTYSTVAHQLGVTDKLADDIRNSWEVLGTISPFAAQKTGLSTDCLVTMGIHDSNASLLPYIVKDYENFVLNSTGTWCVAMHPTNSFHFTEDELGKLVFYNLDAFFNPVKTSIFMGGLEFETYTAILKELNHQENFPHYNHEICQKVIDNKELFILPSVVKDTGLYPSSKPRVIEKSSTFTLEHLQTNNAVPSFFNDYETAYAVLNISLALQTKRALDMTGFKGVGTIFVEGGFRHNDTYNRLLTALYPQSTVALTNLSEATAFGAALCAKAARDRVSPSELKDFFEIDITPVEKCSLSNLDAYGERFESYVNE